MTYSHTQTGLWHWILYAGSAVSAATAILSASENLYLAGILLFTATILAFFGVGFVRMTVEEEDDRLRIRFGPVPLGGRGESGETRDEPRHDSRVAPRHSARGDAAV